MPVDHLEGVDDDLGGDRVVDRPAEDSVAEHVEDHRAIDPSVSRAQ